VQETQWDRIIQPRSKSVRGKKKSQYDRNWPKLKGTMGVSEGRDPGEIIKLRLFYILANSPVMVL
jgi:hypothetical protein